MNTIKSTIRTEAIFSMMKTPLFTQKTWDEKKPACTVITMYPFRWYYHSISLFLSSIN